MKPKWKEWESWVAKMFDGFLNPKSKGQDIMAPRLYIECKQTDKKQFTLTKKTWDKIYWEAVRANKEPVIAIKMGDVTLCVCELMYFTGLREENK